MASNALFLGVDGGGTRCRARLADAGGTRLGEGEAGPGNVRLGVPQASASVREAAVQARLSTDDLRRMTACLALAGTTEPAWLDGALLLARAAALAAAA